jgi:hypothetical protein
MADNKDRDRAQAQPQASEIQQMADSGRPLIIHTVTVPNVPPPATEGLDETAEGGRYLVNGKLVNANGEPIKDK